MQQRDKRQLSPLELDERAASATNILNDPIVQECFEALESKYYGMLVQAPVGDLTATTAHASLKVLGDFKAELMSVVNDKKMRDKYRKGFRDER